MQIYANRKTLLHYPTNEDEGAYRIKDIVSRLPDTNPKVDGERAASLVHAKEYIQFFRSVCEKGGLLAEVEVGIPTWDAAIMSAALAIHAAENNGFAVTRPPGHHATSDDAKGFCFLNNIAIAAKYMLEHHLGASNRIAILDFDGHRGNGTQSIFEDSGNVLYCTMHQKGAWMAGSESIVIEHKGRLSRVQIIMPLGSGDDVFGSAIAIMLDFIREFSPSMIGVSAGFDGYHDDRLLQLDYTERGYYNAGSMIRELSVPKVFAVLEGGYHLHVPDCIESFVAGINGEKFRLNVEPSVSSPSMLRRFEETTAPLKMTVKNR